MKIFAIEKMGIYKGEIDRELNRPRPEDFRGKIAGPFNSDM
jgi:hypothetical protein